VTIINPEAVGNPDQTPIVQLTRAQALSMRLCEANAPLRDGYCGGLNGYHADDCPDRPS
jgi:hypothetical protein